MMTTGNKKRIDAFKQWCHPRLSECQGWRKQTSGCSTRSGLMLRKSVAERHARFFEKTA